VSQILEISHQNFDIFVIFGLFRGCEYTLMLSADPTPHPFAINFVCRDIMPDQWRSTATDFLMFVIINTSNTVMQRRVEVARTAGYAFTLVRESPVISCWID
jgi:hypothetical protein